MKAFEKIFAVFLLIMGISILFVWVMLLIDGEVPYMGEALFKFTLHWSSELFLAVLSIVVSISLFSSKIWARKLSFYNLGMAISSTVHAAYYYSINEINVTLAVMTGSFCLISILFLVMGFKFYKFKNQLKSFLYKFGLFNLGLMIYLLLNVVAKYGQKSEWSIFVNMMFLIIVGLYYVYRLVKVEPY